MDNVMNLDYRLLLPESSDSLYTMYVMMCTTSLDVLIT